MVAKKTTTATTKVATKKTATKKAAPKKEKKVVEAPHIGLVMNDSWLEPFEQAIRGRHDHALWKIGQLTRNGKTTLSQFASGHLYFGLHKLAKGWVFRWELKLSEKALKHGQLYKMKVKWNGGEGERIPAWCRRVVQDDQTKIFSAQVWNPEKPYVWKKKTFKPNKSPLLIYECHVGMAQDAEKVGTYKEFTENVLPRVKKDGYNAIQVMAIQEHPYYGSFGYHVSSFFAPSSRFGTPEDLKEMIDTAHKMGIAVIMDIVHSHAVKNEVEGSSMRATATNIRLGIPSALITVRMMCSTSCSPTVSTGSRSFTSTVSASMVSPRCSTTLMDSVRPSEAMATTSTVTRTTMPSAT